LELLGPSKTSQTVLFSKPILLAGGKITRIGWVKPIFPRFLASNPSATRCYLAGKPKDPRLSLLGSGERGEKRKPRAHTTPDMKMGQLVKIGVEREMDG